LKNSENRRFIKNYHLRINMPEENYKQKISDMIFKAEERMEKDYRERAIVTIEDV